MQRMGNSNAKSIYEANLPVNFPIPQTDSYLFYQLDTSEENLEEVF